MNKLYKESLILSPDGILVVSENDEILVANTAMLDLLNVNDNPELQTCLNASFLEDGTSLLETLKQ